MTTRFVKLVNNTHHKIPDGTVGKVTDSSPIMGLIYVDLVGYGDSQIWSKNLETITEKEYFIGVLQGGK